MTVSRKPVAFVIMPFAANFDDVFRLLIIPALAGYEVVRADSRLDERGILEKIMTGIEEADLVIADVTGTNPNVMYELGVAHALGKPTVMLARSADQLPFDIRAYQVHQYSMDTDRAKVLAKQLNDLAARHREGLVQFGNPVADFVPRVVVSVSQLTEDAGYSVTDCNDDLEWAVEAIGSFYGRFNSLLEKHAQQLSTATVSITGGQHGLTPTENPGIRAAANDVRDFARELDELATAFHGVWERFGRAMLWVMAPERRSLFGVDAARRSVLRARNSDEMLNGILGDLADLRHVTDSFPRVSGNLSHALETERLVITNLLNEIMTAKAYLARIIQAGK